jgi:hypothetical protein
MVTEEGKSYLGEINLSGGIKGASITPEEYGNKIEEIHQQLLAEILN